MKPLPEPDSNQAMQKVATLYALNLSEEMVNNIHEKESKSGWEYRITDYLDKIDGVYVDHTDSRFSFTSIYVHIDPKYDGAETFTKIKEVVKNFASKKS